MPTSPPMPFDPSSIAIAGIPILFLIISLIEAAKRYAPRAPGNHWFAVALALGVILFSLAHIADHGAPTTLAEALELVVTGLMFGLAAGGAYEQLVKPQRLSDAEVARHIQQDARLQRLRRAKGGDETERHGG